MGSQPRNPQRSGPDTPNSCGKCTLYYNRLKFAFLLNIHNLGMC